MAMFDDEDNMIIPLSIDDIDATKNSYYKSTPKVVISFVALLPYIISAIFIYTSLPSMAVLITFTVLYLVLYTFIIRKFVIEEDVQKASLHELQDNKYSNFSYFWEIDKIGDNKDKDSGLMYLRQDGVTLKRGLVVFFDSGSIVGTSDDFLHNYRETKQKFLRALYQNQFSFKWYDIKKQAELNPSLIKQSEGLPRIENEALRQLLKLQLNAYLRYSMDAEQRYVNYVVITNKDFSTLMNFKNVVEDIINNTLRTNPAFKDVRILTKPEVDEFFATYYLQDDVDANSISKSTRSKPFSEYARVTEIVDRTGEIVDITLLDTLNNQIAKDSIGLAIDEAFDNDERQRAKVERRRLKERELAVERLNKERLNDKMTHEEYTEEMEILERNYSKEFYNPNRIEEERLAEKEQRKQEREAQRLAKQQSKIKVEPEPEPKWYESEDLQEAEELDSNEWNENNEHDVDVYSLLEDDSPEPQDSEQSNKMDYIDDLLEDED